MPLFQSKSHIPPNDLNTIKDAIVALLHSQDASMCIVEKPAWWSTVRHYHCIVPKKSVDELAPPGDDTDGDPLMRQQEERQRIILLKMSSLQDGIGELISTNGHSVRIKGDVYECMERCFPDYRLRSEMRAQGWQIDLLQDGQASACIRGAQLMMGSQLVGLLLEVSTTDSLIESLQGIIEDHFTPVSAISIEEHCFSLAAKR